MKIKLGIVMDSIKLIDIDKDSSFAMLIEAQNRRYEIYYIEEKDLFLESENAFAISKKIKIKKDKKRWFNFIDNKKINLCELDIILMRKDPPVNMQFIYTTYILEQAEKKGTIIINKPKNLRNFNEKIFIFDFKEIIPKTIVTKDIKIIKNFIEKQKEIVLKPLDLMGGKSIFRIKKNDPNYLSIVELMTNYEKKYCMAQEYIPEINNGDKRIIIINGKVIPWLLKRIPKNGETRANIMSGGKGIVEKINEKDLKIAKIIAKKLKSNKIFLAGIDIIGDKLTEINITSPTCIVEIQKFSKVPICKIIMNEIENQIKIKQAKS
ncbi:glutathione synthase [Buchnera aphidicola (Neophyllaphis podocarpi)]|uniref:glutathione synthase n=1 Tax=Buchnera aphidicola TaxID=9 RepID=UPI0031B8A8F4